MMTRPARLKGADVGIPPRQLDFHIPAELPKWAYAGNATATCFLAMLSALFPPGEDFFVQSVLRYRHLVEDPELRARVAGFTGQEVIHSREHDRLNEAFTSQGFDLTIPDRAIRASLAVLRLLPGSKQIACTAMMEHFTAVLAEELLANEDFRDNIHAGVAGLWLWHALEELEHKSVTFDVYELVGNSDGERLLAELLVLVVVAPAAVVGWVGLMAQQRVWTIPGDVRTGLELVFGRNRFLPRVLRLMPLFRRPGFHPDNHDSSAVESEWRERLFGAAGTLTTQLRRPVAG
jgi:uncharacterized protein